MTSDNKALIALAALALVGCDMPSDQQIRRDATERRYDRAYDKCLYRVTGPFAAASIEVMRECERQARASAIKESQPK